MEPSSEESDPVARRKDGSATTPDDPAAAPDLDPSWVEAVQRRLIAWYDHHHRPLPWRETRDPYRILVSETMLVQTTVAAAIPFYHRFLERFPTIDALAAASEADVLKVWEGLGYYRRARLLHQAARVVVERHGGTVPSDPHTLAELPGVGRYIAGAVRSFAFDQPAPIVEANTQRLLARWLAIQTNLKAKPTQDRLWRAAERLVPPDQPGRFNQAFMELGALICKPTQPDCPLCPVTELCQARTLGLEERLPILSAKPTLLEGRELAVIVTLTHGGDANASTQSILLVQRGSQGLWAGFWEPPILHLDGANPAERPTIGPQPTSDDLAKALNALVGLPLVFSEISPSARVSSSSPLVTPSAWEDRNDAPFQLQANSPPSREPRPRRTRRSPADRSSIRYVVTKHRMTLEARQARVASPTASPPAANVSTATPEPRVARSGNLVEARFVTRDHLAALALTGPARSILSPWLAAVR